MRWFKALVLLVMLTIMGCAAQATPSHRKLGFGGGGGGGGGGGSGTVTSVSGTANQVSVANGTTTPVISLVGPYTPSTYTAHGILLGEGTASIVPTAVCGTGSILFGQTGADPICSTLILPNAATAGDLLSATSTNTIGRIADVATGQVLASGGVGTVPAYTASPTISGANITPLAAPYGATTYTVHGLIVGEAAGNLAATAACGTGTFLYGQGGSADPICSTLTLPNSATTGDLLTATGTNAVGSVADVAVNQVLASGGVGTVPAYTTNPRIGSIGVGVAASGTAGQIALPNGSDNTKIGDLANSYIQFSTASGADMPITLRGHTDILLEDGSNSHHSVAIQGGLAFQVTGGTAPTLTAGCNGAGSSVAAGSTNNRGQFTTQTAAATTCTLTWSAAGTWQQAPFCLFADGQAQITPKAYSEGTTNTTSTTVDFVSASNAVIQYMCM